MKKLVHIVFDHAMLKISERKLENEDIRSPRAFKSKKLVNNIVMS